MAFQSYASLRDELRRQGRALEESALRTPPSDYAAFMKLVGQRHGLRIAEELVSNAMQPDVDDNDSE